MDPRKWPDVMTIGGVPCSLGVQTGEYDAIWFVRSLNEVKPGANYGLFYSRVPNDRQRSQRGPAYYWRGDSTLTERYWKGGDSLRLESLEYIYYPSGELFRFISRSEEPNLRTEARSASEMFEELFARNGTLIGCVYSSGGGAAKRVPVGYWMGTEVGYREYHKRMIEAQLRTFK
jgi:hypothetical protein